MSTNKTQHYHLHAWEAGDDFLRTEINENFAGLERVIRGQIKVVAGTYIGDGTKNREINLGAPILALLLENTFGSRTNGAFVHGGLVLPGLPLERESCVIQGTKFIVTTDSSLQTEYRRTNQNNLNYAYIALLDMA